MKLADAALDQLFRTARTYNAFSGRRSPTTTLHAIYDLMKWGPTAGQQHARRGSCSCAPREAQGAAAGRRCRPATSTRRWRRRVDVDRRLRPASSTRQLPKLFPHTDARSWFAGKAGVDILDHARSASGTLQGAYYHCRGARARPRLRARCRGFDNAKWTPRSFRTARGQVELPLQPRLRRPGEATSRAIRACAFDGGLPHRVT